MISGEKYHVCVLGAGIAGLSAAVFAREAGFNVTLIESKPRLGGRAYTIFEDDNITIDNGQHILASWYKNTLKYFSIIGSQNKIKIQDRLNINFYEVNGANYKFSSLPLPSPFDLISGIFRYKALSMKDKLSMVRLIFNLMLNKYEDLLNEISVAELFTLTKQTDNLIKKFWKPFVIAVFNSTPERTSAFLFKEIIETGFIKKGGSGLVLPSVNLYELFIEPSLKYFDRKNCRLFKGLKINNVVIKNNNIDHIITEEGIDRYFDYYISTLPFFEFDLLKPYIKINDIKYSPILNIHIIFKESIDNIFKEDFIGVLEADIQWVFKVSSHQVCIVISSAEKLVGEEKSRIFDITYTELTGLKPEFKNLSVITYKVIKEVRATFIPDNTTNRNRPPHKTSIQNLFLAGDWTKTDLPCTIESAVLSSRRCVDHILESVN